MSLMRFPGSVNSLAMAFLAASAAHSLRPRTETVMGVRAHLGPGTDVQMKCSL